VLDFGLISIADVHRMGLTNMVQVFSLVVACVFWYILPSRRRVSIDTMRAVRTEGEYMWRNTYDVIPQLTTLETTVRSSDLIAIQPIPVRVEDGVPGPGQLTIEAMRVSALLLQPLDNSESLFIIARPRMIGLRTPESRANAS
jgi:hypothetical protein